MIEEIEDKIKISKKLEPEITKLLKKLAKKYKGTLEGLKYKFKDKEKLYKKAYSKKIDKIRDALRYTIVFKENNYTSGVYNIYSELEKNKDFRTKHSWIKQKWCLGHMYQGVNTSWEYKGQFVFELQFHTKISHKTKTTGILHDLYDKYSSSGCNSAFIGSKEYKKNKCYSMRNKMNKIENSIPIPKELIGQNCGLDISEWFKIINKKKTKKRKSKRKSKRKTNKN